MATAERIRSNPMESRGFSDNEQMDTAHITHQMGSTQMSSQQDSGFQNTLFQGQGSSIEQNMGSQTQGQSDFKRSQRQNEERGGTTFSMTETIRKTTHVVKEKNPSRSRKSNSGTQDFEDDKTDYDELSSEKRKNKVMKMIKNSHIEKIKNYIFLKEIDNAYDEMIRLRASGDIASSKEMERELNSLTEQGLKVPVYVDKQPETTDGEPVKSTKPEQTADGYEVNEQTAESAVEIEPTPVVGEPSRTKPKAPEQAEIRVEQKPVEKPTAEAKPELNGKRIWGTVIRQLRANNSLMLWTACQDADVKVAGDKLIVYVDGENEVTLFNKNDNLKTLQNIVSGICPLKVEIAVRGQVIDELAADVERIKRDFTNVTIEK